MIEILSPEETARLTTALFYDHRAPSTPALLMLQCGLRSYEATQARASHLLPDPTKISAITIPTTSAKRAIERTVPIPAALAELIFFRLQGNNFTLTSIDPPDRPLAKSKRGGPISTRWLEMWIQNKSIQVIGHKITPYTLRHTFASKARKHCDLATLQLILGHKNLKSTQVYLHPTLTEMRNAIEATNAND